MPANHHMLAAGIEEFGRRDADLHPRHRAAGMGSERGWLGRHWPRSSPPMLRFLEDKTPLAFELVNHPDFYVEAPGGKLFGRMVSPTLISRYILGRLVEPRAQVGEAAVLHLQGDGRRRAQGSAARRAEDGPGLVWRVVAGKVGPRQRADRRPDARLPRPWLHHPDGCRREAAHDRRRTSSPASRQ